MLQRLDRKIDVEPGPMQMMRRWSLDVQEFADRGFSKPWKLFELDEQLISVEQEPKAVSGHVGDFNVGNGFSTLRGEILSRVVFEVC